MKTFSTQHVIGDLHQCVGIESPNLSSIPLIILIFVMVLCTLFITQIWQKIHLI